MKKILITIGLAMAILYLQGCANNGSATAIKINVKNNAEPINILSRAQVMFTITKKTGDVHFLEAYRYGTNYYDDESDWKDNVAKYQNDPSIILGCIDVDAYNMFGGKELYSNCISNKEYKLMDVSKTDMIKVLQSVRYNINDEYKAAKNNTILLERLLAKLHLSPTEKDTLQIQLIKILEQKYKRHKTAANYFKLHNLIHHYWSAFYSTDWDEESEANKRHYKKLQMTYLMKAYDLSKDKIEREMIRNMAYSYSDFVGFNKLVDISKDVNSYASFLKHFGLSVNQKMVSRYSEVLYYIDSKKGKLDISTIEKLLGSSYYKNILSHKIPTVTTGYNNGKYYFQLEYDVSDEKMTYKYTFVPVCRYVDTTTKVEDLGFFEVFGTGGMAENKNVTYNLYSCDLKRSDKKQILSFERKLGINDFSKILNTAPWTKYEVIAKTYNRATYIAPTGSQAPMPEQRRNQSSTSNQYLCTYTCKGVNEVENKVQVYGKDNNDAQLKSEKIAAKYCRETFHTTVLNKWGSGETKCTKQ